MYIVPIQAMTGLEKLQEAREVNAPEPSGGSFKDILSQAYADYQQAKAVADQDGYLLAFGEADNLAQIQINAMKAETMLQTTVQLTSRMVSAYKEIMQMQI
ncbi:MAG: flagellar hook-basal body complex protein FliE [Oscillospiraceae bacterium]|jgi:flagellar hook-basal body complex protein FliE|nr:flagellar hook-basal body complex protein FliE [Oscillospiraceae bacterium]